MHVYRVIKHIFKQYVHSIISMFKYVFSKVKTVYDLSQFQLYTKVSIYRKIRSDFIVSPQGSL